MAGVESYLKAAARDLVRNAGLFVGANGAQASKLTRGAGTHPRFARYGVHVMATTSAAGGAPVVQEPNPTYANLFGRIELGTAPTVRRPWCASSRAHCIAPTAAIFWSMATRCSTAQ